MSTYFTATQGTYILRFIVAASDCRIFPIFLRPGVKTRHDDIDVVVVRQNTEGEYAMLEHENVPGVVESLKIITADNTKRLVNWAFKYAIENNRKKVTLVHKA